MIDYTKTGAEMFANAEVGEEVFIATKNAYKKHAEYLSVGKFKIARVLKTKVVFQCGREFYFKVKYTKFPPSWVEAILDPHAANAAMDQIKLVRRLKMAREKFYAMSDEKLLLIIEAIEGV